jgi:hypothetical protein
MWDGVGTIASRPTLVGPAGFSHLSDVKALLEGIPMFKVNIITPLRPPPLVYQISLHILSVLLLHGLLSKAVHNNLLLLLRPIAFAVSTAQLKAG